MNEIAKFSILDEKTFAISDKIWTKSDQLIAKMSNDVEFYIFFWEKILNSFTVIRPN